MSKTKGVALRSRTQEGPNRCHVQQQEFLGAEIRLPRDTPTFSHRSERWPKTRIGSCSQMEERGGIFSAGQGLEHLLNSDTLYLIPQKGERRNSLDFFVIWTPSSPETRRTIMFNWNLCQAQLLWESHWALAQLLYNLVVHAQEPFLA